MNKNHFKGVAKQRGISLIELMVGLLIGLFVVAAALSSVIFTRSAQVTQSDSARLQQQASAVIRIIGLQLKQAGAVEMVNAADGKVMFDTRFTGFNDVQDVIVSGADGGGRPARSGSCRVPPRCSEYRPPHSGPPCCAPRPQRRPSPQQSLRDWPRRCAPPR